MGWYTTLAVSVSALAVAAVLTPLPEVEKGGNEPLTIALKLGYLGGFAWSFGTTLWVTFIAGIVLFRALPRHQFGMVQSHLFPAYFRLVAAASAVALACFAVLHPLRTAKRAEQWEAGALALPMAGALLNLLVFEPVTTKIMRDRHRIERDAGIGNEVGLSKNREVAKTNPELAAINRKFGMWHGLSSLANLVGLVGLGAHLYYLATRIPV